jgi:cytochrome c55X
LTTLGPPARNGRRLIWIGLCAAALHAPLRAQPTDEQLVAKGRQLYTSFCARCHGVNMVTSGAAFDLRSFPADQRERFERSVNQGLRAMPAWGSILKPADVQALWQFVTGAR